jgi:uncharacterized membrane protein
MQLRSKHIGGLLGFGLAWIFIQYGFFPGVFVLVVALLGWTVGRILDGEIDVIEFLRRRSGEDLE